MNATNKIKAIIYDKMKFNDESSDLIAFYPGMNSDELESFKQSLPCQRIPQNIEELLRFTKGLKIPGIEDVRFDAFNCFGFEDVFPYSIQLAGDGCGNFWILDIDSTGEWNSVYYVCHDPAVIIKQSENISEYIDQINAYIENEETSSLAMVRDSIAKKVWDEKNGIMETNEKNYTFDMENSKFPELFLVADMTDKPIETGFAWGKFGTNVKIIRPNDKPIWILEKKIKQSLISKLFRILTK